MAMTEEELARMSAQIELTTEALSKFTGAMYGATPEQLAASKADKDAAKAAAQFQARLDTATAAVGALAGVFVNYNKEVYKSGNANKAAAASIESMGEAAKYAGAFLALLVPGGPLVKAAVAGLGLLASELIKSGKLIAEQTDEIYKAYQDMAKAGAAGAGGMQDVFDSLQKVGMGTEKFGAYIKLVNENANDLAVFGGSVNKGRKIFENTMSSLSTEQRVQMEQMGLDREAQATATMAYIKQQRLLTQGTKSQMDTSSAAVMKYIQETDTLTRLTGLNRQEQEKLHDDAMRNEAYNATMQEIRETQGEEGVRRVQEAAAMAQKAGPETFKQFQASLSGFVGSSNEAQQAFMATGGKIAEVTDALRSGQVKNTKETAVAMNGLFKAYGETAQQFRGQAKMMNYGPTFGSYYEAVKAGSMSLESLAEVVAQVDNAEEERRKQLADPKTKAMAEAMNATVDQQLKLQRGVNMGMDAYITGLGKVTNANATALDILGNAARSAAEALGLIGGGKKVQQSAAVQDATKATAATRDTAKPLQDRVDALNKQIDEDEKTLKEAKRAGKSVAEMAALEEKIKKTKDEELIAAKELDAQDQIIKQAQNKETAIRKTQVAEQGKMNRLERAINQEKEQLAELNEAKYNLEKYLAQSGTDAKTLAAGRKRVASLQESIDKKQKSLTEQQSELTNLQKKLAPPGAAPAAAPAGGAPAGGAPAAAPAAPAGGAPAAAPAAPAGGAPAGGAPPAPAGGAPATRGAMPPAQGRKEVSLEELQAKKQRLVRAGPRTKNQQSIESHEEELKTLDMAIAEKSKQVKDIKDYLQFGGESGSETSFKGLSPDLQQGILTAAKQYKESTGKPLTINSAARTPEKQKELYDKWVAGGKKGMPVAPPGSSLHEQGKAVDIQEGISSSVAIAALNSQGLFQTVPNDPVHFQPKAFGDGGVVNKPTLAQIGEKGPEAVIPLKGGQVPVHINSDSMSALGGGGWSELQGYNMGAITTDIAVLQKIAGKLGAYDKSTEMITDPKLWKEILQSGMLMNYDVGAARIGTKGLSEIAGSEAVADALAGRIKELIDTKKDSGEAIAQTRTEFADMMKTFYTDFFAKMQEEMRKESPLDSEMLAVLKDISKTNAAAAGSSEKMLRYSQN